MNINGKFFQFDEEKRMSYLEFGKLLLETSPNKDGVGLKVELTEHEQSRFQFNFEFNLGDAIYGLIERAIKEVGGNPKLQYTYSYPNRTFVTLAAA
jgi:hypothetical protein